MQLYSRAQARRALFHTVGLRVVSQVTTALGFIVLVRGLSEQSLGIYSLLYSIIPVIGTVLSLGLDQVLKRFQPEFLQAGNQGAAAWLMRVVTRARLVANLILIAGIFLAWDLLAPLFKLDGYRSDFALFSLIVLMAFQTILLQSSLASHMLHRYSVGSVVVLSVGKLAAYGSVGLFFTWSLRNAILADVAAYVATFGFLAWAHWRNCRPPPEQQGWRPGSAERKRLTRYAVASNFNESGSLLLHNQTDNFFIAGIMKSPAAVGAYSFYARITEMCANLIPVRLFENVVQPMLYATPREQAAERLPRYFTFLVNISMLAQWPLLAFTFVYHHEIIELFFGGKFAEYSSLLPVTVLFAWTNNVFSTPITLMALYRENAALILRSQLFGLYQIAAMFALIPLLGLYGAAIATGTLHLFRNIWVWWKVREDGRWLNYRSAVLSGLVIWGGVIALSVLLRDALRAPHLVDLLVGVLLCGVGVLVFLRSPAFSESDRELMSGVLHGRESAILRILGFAPRTPPPAVLP